MNPHDDLSGDPSIDAESTTAQKSHSFRAEEMAYILLDDCQVELVGETGQHEIDVRGWSMVDQSSPTSRSHADELSVPSGTKEERLGLVESPSIGSRDDDICRRCNLVVRKVLRTDSKDSAFQLDWREIPSFHGTVHDCFALKNTTVSTSSAHLSRTGRFCGCQTRGKPRKRSDAALLAGLLVACSTHVSVVQCSILFHESTNRSSLLFTLAFPYLSKCATTRQSIISTCSSPSNKRARSIGTNESLHPALQLLFTLIRSDWGHLENLQATLLSFGPPRLLSGQDKPSLFPSRLALGALYERIQATHSNIEHIPFHPNKLTESEPAALTDLPVDLLVQNIAPYFQATSLASLRSTCHSMYSSLRGVVPGLRLRLYSHQCNSLSWMRQRESSLLQTEANILKISTTNNTFVPDGDVHRAVTGGTTVLLASRPVANTKSSWSVRLNINTGHALRPEQCSNVSTLPRSVARGGLLCDDPGLGKTITVLALILQTHGLSAGSLVHDSPTRVSADSPQQEEPCDSPTTHTENEDDALFNAYWTERVVADFRRPALLKVVNELSKRLGSIPLAAVKASIGTDAFGTDFASFERAVEDAIARYNHDVNRSSLIFKELLLGFKETQMRSARKSFSNARSRPNSRVAAIIEEEARCRLLCSLAQSNGTLLVVPSVLVEHWKTQINRHLDFGYCTSKIPLVFDYKKKESGMSVDKATILCQLHQTHTPFLFLDYGTRPLPSADFLAQFQIVITTTLRFMNEAKKGSFQDELDRQYQGFADDNGTEVPQEACELLKIHWSRMVVDEGHSMGNDKSNSTIQFASWVRARRRWAMTGTPTKQNAGQIGQLLGLTRFLQHDFFSPRLEGDEVWKRGIAKGWREGELASFFRLHKLLGFLMKRHIKADIVELTAPIFHKTEVTMSYLEASTYNTLVSAVQTNLQLTSMDGKTSGFQDSLLHRSQAKHARSVIQNIRRVCTGLSRVIPTLTSQYFQETMEMARNLQLPTATIDKITQFLWRAENEELTACDFCSIRISTLLIMPCCGGLICTECLDTSIKSCNLCEDSFDVDELQKFQPGFDLDWRHNIESRNPTAPLAASSGGTLSQAPAGVLNNDLLVQNQVIRPSIVRRRKNKAGDGHECMYDRFGADGRCVLCLEEHNHCNLLNTRSRCDVCHRLAEPCPIDESKSYHLVRRLLDLHKSRSRQTIGRHGAAYSNDVTRPLKAIVFSQFRASLNIVGDRLLRRFGTACIAEYVGAHRKHELHKFTTDPECFCLLLTKDGSEGLDLSFVTNIVFFEEIYDRSLQDQAVARAWRMGAAGRVEVETLIASHSLEEILGDRSEKDDGDDAGVSAGGDQLRIKFLLQSLRYNTDYHHFSGSTDTRQEHMVKVIADGKPRRSRQRPMTEDVQVSKRKKCSSRVSFADLPVSTSLIDHLV